MKTLKALVPVLLLTVAVAGMTGCGRQTRSQSPDTPSTNAGKATQYFCPMHPEVVQASSGKCPKCGMDLVEKH